MTAYQSYPQFYVSVDCIIFGFAEGHLKVLIHQRPYEPVQLLPVLLWLLPPPDRGELSPVRQT